jgi:hypothetical protein
MESIVSVNGRFMGGVRYRRPIHRINKPMSRITIALRELLDWKGFRVADLIAVSKPQSAKPLAAVAIGSG